MSPDTSSGSGCTVRGQVVRLWWYFLRNSFGCLTAQASITLTQYAEGRTPTARRHQAMLARLPHLGQHQAVVPGCGAAQALDLEHGQPQLGAHLFGHVGVHGFADLEQVDELVLRPDRQRVPEELQDGVGQPALGPRPPGGPGRGPVQLPHPALRRCARSAQTPAARGPRGGRPPSAGKTSRVGRGPPRHRGRRV